MITNFLDIFLIDSEALDPLGTNKRNESRINIQVGGSRCDDFVMSDSSSLLSSTAINNSLRELNRNSYALREAAFQRLRLHMQTLVTAGYINRLEVFMARLEQAQSSTSDVEGRQRIQALLNNSVLLDNFTSVPERNQRGFIRFLAGRGLISQSIISNNPGTRAHAASVESNPHILTFLSQDRSALVRREVARNANTTHSAITILIEDEDALVRREVAGSSRITPATLSLLVKDQSELVRREVAGNRSTPSSALTILASDQDSIVRRTVAVNRNTTAVTLATLSGDEDVNVRALVAGNRNTTSTTLTTLAGNQEALVRAIVAQNLNATPTLLTNLSGDQDTLVRASVVQNSNTPIAILQVLTQDQDAEVAASARIFLAARIRENN